MRKQNILFVLFLSLAFSFTMAQDDKDTYNENVTINVAFDPMINDANKIDENISVFDTSFSQVDLTFDRIKKGYKTMLTFDTIKAASVKGEPQAELYRINLKGGLGLAFGKDLKLAFTPLLQGSYTSLKDRSLLYGVDIYSFSGLSGEKNYGHNGYSQEDLNLYAKKIFKHYAVSSRAFYNYSRNYYYGSTLYPEKNISKGDYRISWHNVGADLSYSTLERDNSFQHNGRINFQYTGNNQGGGEFYLHTALDGYKDLDLFNGASNQKLGLSFDYKHSFSKTNKALFDLAPYFIFDWDKFRFFASLGLEPGIKARKGFQLLPTATVSFELINQLLSLYGGLKSETEMPLLNSLRTENPFIQASPVLEDNTKNTFFAKGFLNITQKAQLTLEVGYQKLKNQYFFTNTEFTKKNIYNVHRLVYDDAGRYYITSENYFSVGNNFYFNIIATLQRTNRNNSEFEAWYNPAFRLQTKINYTYGNKLHITLSPSFNSKSYAYAENLKKEVEVKAMFDLSLSATYQYNERWSFFADLNNLTFNQYYLYYNYPTHTFNFLLGCIYKI
ncbi:MAG: hypothetical protein IJ748_01110 [Bacteroidales bacterium]|nr:hypothetical protein [Bacteroidales bacterium]